MTHQPVFLTDEELRYLTGRAFAKDQIAVLRKQGIPFFENARNQPRVTRAAVEGRIEQQTTKKEWQPRPLRAA
jgi:hypothetical protein